MKTPAPLFAIALSLLLAAVLPLQGQSMIDLTKEEVRARVEVEHREFRRDRSIVNQQFNYLKYVNGLRTRTWILYFTDEDICRSSKLVCDYGEYDEVLEDLNKRYDKVGESEWTYKLKRDTVYVVLTRQEWYFTVREARTK